VKRLPRGPCGSNSLSITGLDPNLLPHVIVLSMRSLVACMTFAGICLLSAASPQPTHAQSGNVAATPPMGWNSWDSYGLTITEPQFRANVAVLQHKLLPFGWQYAVIDEGWYFENPQVRSTPEKLQYVIDAYGRFVPDPKRFPSAILPSSSLPLHPDTEDGAETSPPGSCAASVSTAAYPNQDRAAHPRGSTQPQQNCSNAGYKLQASIQATSFSALGRWVHAQGLKFGIHIIRGIPKVSVERNLPIQGSNFHAQDAADQSDACPWDPTSWGVRNNAAGQAWYDSLLRQYASWGVDLIKVDCIADHPFKLDEIQMIRRAIDKTGRPIVLSLSPGPTALSHAPEVTQLSNLWRISNDEWDLWSANGATFPQGVEDQFARLSRWEPYAGPGHWPDADMLPLGQLRPNPGWGSPRATRLTPEEQRTQVTLWSIARSPLILGANLTLLDPPTLALLTNREVLAINQTAASSFQVLHQGSLIVWQANLPAGEIALAVFNTGFAPLDLQRKFVSFNPRLGTYAWRVRDVWAGKDLGNRRSVSVRLTPHACLLLLLRPLAPVASIGSGYHAAPAPPRSGR